MMYKKMNAVVLATVVILACASSAGAEDPRFRPDSMGNDDPKVSLPQMQQQEVSTKDIVTNMAAVADRGGAAASSGLGGGKLPPQQPGEGKPIPSNWSIMHYVGPNHVTGEYFYFVNPNNSGGFQFLPPVCETKPNHGDPSPIAKPPPLPGVETGTGKKESK